MPESAARKGKGTSTRACRATGCRLSRRYTSHATESGPRYRIRLTLPFPAHAAGRPGAHAGIRSSKGEGYEHWSLPSYWLPPFAALHPPRYRIRLTLPNPAHATEPGSRYRIRPTRLAGRARMPESAARKGKGTSTRAGRATGCRLSRRYTPHATESGPRYRIRLTLPFPAHAAGRPGAHAGIRSSKGEGYEHWSLPSYWLPPFAALHPPRW